MRAKMQSISLKNHEGKEVCLKDFLGQWLLLYFYPKDDTPGCSLQARDFSSNIEFFKNYNIRVVGVSPDDVESHKKFFQKYALNISLLSDPKKLLIQAFSAWGIKKNYGKEYEGLIRSSFLINPEGVLVCEWRNVRAKGHVEKLMRELPQLFQDKKRT